MGYIKESPSDLLIPISIFSVITLNSLNKGCELLLTLLPLNHPLSHYNWQEPLPVE